MTSFLLPLSPSVQLSSVAQSCPTLCDPCTAARQASLSITNSRSLLKLMSIELVMPSNHLILCRPLLLPPSISPSIGSFPMNQFFTSGGQSIGVSALTSVLLMNIQASIPLGLTDLISLQSKGHFFFSFIFISWRLITLQYCSGFCHTLTWISHGITCIPHPDPPSHLPLYPIPLGPPSAPGPSTCLMHPTWAGDLFHPR